MAINSSMYPSNEMKQYFITSGGFITGLIGIDISMGYILIQINNGIKQASASKST